MLSWLEDLISNSSANLGSEEAMPARASFFSSVRGFFRAELLLALLPA